MMAKSTSFFQKTGVWFSAHTCSSQSTVCNSGPRGSDPGLLGHFFYEHKLKCGQFFKQNSLVCFVNIAVLSVYIFVQHMYDTRRESDSVERELLPCVRN